jgi:hypothetical protein
MQNNVGIYASQISGHLWAPNGAMDALATVTVPSGGAASIEFAGIPQGYKHLQLRVLARSGSTASGGNYLSMRFNGDSGSNYTYHALQGDGSSATAAGLASQNTVYLQRMANNNDASGIYGAMVVDLLDYSNVTKYKTVRNLGAYDANGSGRVYFSSSAWMNTAAVTSISIAPESSTFNQYSSFALYGVR